MKRAARIALIIILVLLALAASVALAALPRPGEPGAPADPRYCGEPARGADGVITRNRAELRRFAKAFPCPATLQPTSSCRGWAIDHVIPLVHGGCDKAVNMHWLPIAIKSCAHPACKDRWERTYHAHPRQPVVIWKEKP